MKIYTGNLLQMIAIWIALSSCFQCYWKRNNTHSRPPHHELQLPDIETSLQEYALSEYPIPTISDLLIEASSQYYSIIKQYAEFIQPCTSATSILHLESQLGTLQDIHGLLHSPWLQAEHLEIKKMFDQKLQTIKDIQVSVAQLKKVPTQLASEEEKSFLQAQQALSIKISSLCSRLAKELEEAKRNNLVVTS